MAQDVTDVFLRWAREGFCYEHDVFLSYSTQQQTQAKTVYNQLSPNLKTFFAPISLKTSELTPNQFVDLLTTALLQSCQLVVMLSSSYLESSWCLLEMHGYFNLLRRSRERRMWILPVEPLANHLIGQLVPFIQNIDNFADRIMQATKCLDVNLGDRFADLEAPRMFVELPLRQFYEPPTRGNRPPWGKDHRTPHGVPGAPSYEDYERLVREYMVQIMRMGDATPLTIPVIGAQERYPYISKDAENDARRMIQLEVSPFQGPFTRNLADWLREIGEARTQGRDPAEMDRLEGAARAKAGFLDEGVRLMKQGLKANEPINDKDHYITEIARAEYLAKRFKKALKALQELKEPFSESAILVRAAIWARLGKLSTEEIERNRNSGVRVNDVRIDSDIERRDHLDYWAEGLELAGFQR